jgi:hypothetical protein
VARTDPNPEQQALAQELAALLQGDADDFLRELTQTLTAADTADLFGQTQFVLRDLALRFAAKACARLLREKKTATTAPATLAPTAAKAPPSTATATGPS